MPHSINKTELIIMAEEQNQPQFGAEQNAQGGQFQLQKIYVKDVSFELPNAPQVFTTKQSGEIKLNLAQRVNDIGNNVYEVVLTVTVTAKAGEGTAYLAEVHQAGLFGIAGLNDAQRHAALNTICPQTLFPYATRVITSLVADGGFPPLVLQPINFEAVYQQRLSEAAKGQTPAGDLEVQGNA